MYITLLLLLSPFSRVRLCATPKMAAHQAPPSLGFSSQEHWSGLPFPCPMHESEKWKWSRSVISGSSQPHGLQPARLLCPWDFPGKGTGVGCHCLLHYITLVLSIWHIDNIFGGVSGVIGPGMTGFNNGLGPWGPRFYSSKAWGWWAKIPILALVKVSEQQQRVPGDGLLKPQVKSTVWGAEPQQCRHSNCGSEPWLGPRVKNRVAAVCFCCSLTQSCPITMQSSEQQATCQVSLSFTISQSLVKLMSIELRMPSNHLILCHPLLILPSIFPRIRLFSNESALHLRWPKYWFSFSISPSNEYSGLIVFRIDWFDLLAIQGISRVFSSTIIWKHLFEGTQPSLWSNSHIHT